MPFGSVKNCIKFRISHVSICFLSLLCIFFQDNTNKALFFKHTGAGICLGRKDRCALFVFWVFLFVLERPFLEIRSAYEASFLIIPTGYCLAPASRIKA